MILNAFSEVHILPSDLMRSDVTHHRRKVFGANKCEIMKGRHLDRANNPLILQFICTDIKARQYTNAVRLGQQPLDSEAKL